MSFSSPIRSFFLTFDFIILTFAAALFFFVFHSFLLLPLQIENLGGNPSEIGFIMGISGASMLFFTPLSGFLADRYGRKIFVSLGFLILFVSCAGFIFLQTMSWKIYALRILHGAAFSFFFTSAGAIVTEITPEGQRVQAMGIYGMFTIVGYAVAPYIGKMVVDYGGFSSLFVFVSAMSFAGIFVSLFVREKKEPGELKCGEKSRGFGLSVPFSRPLVLAVSVLFISGWVFLSQFSFVSLSSHLAGIENFYLFFVFFTVAVLFVRIFLGWVPDKYGIYSICPPFLFLSFVSVVILAFSQTVSLVSLAGFLFGISHGLTYPSLYLLAMEESENRSKAKVFALCSASFTSGGMLGTFLSGALAHSVGYFSMYLVLSIVALSGFFAFLFVRRFGGFGLVKGVL